MVVSERTFQAAGQQVLKVLERAQLAIDLEPDSC